MTSILIYALLSATLVIVNWFCGLRFKNSANTPYPPGPKGKPLIGNIFDISRNKPWIGLASLRKKYGGIVYLSVLGKHILVINSREDAFELLDKRSKIYSDRPDISAMEMVGFDFATPSLKYSHRWRSHRKLYQQFMRPGEVEKFRVIQVFNVHKMLRDMLNVQPRVADHYRRLPGSIIMKVVYNIDITEEEHRYYVELAQEAERNIGKLAYLSAMLPTVFPLIEYVPAWVPGIGSLKRVILETRILTHKMLTVPFEAAEKNCDPSSSLVMRLLTDLSDTDGGDYKRNIRDVCATAYAAGVDTSVVVIENFFYAMLVSPEAQKKAQAEIDDVIGNARLPNFDDRDALHYVEAVYREVLRWYPVVPLTFFRVTTMDDIYNGYFIPKGTLVIPNSWAMTHDESVYHNPDNFLPERFLNEHGELTDDLSDLAFGFGRRVCPGRRFASDTIWLTIVTMLAVFNIRHTKDEYGNDIPVSGEYTNELISHHEPFECSVAPRSDSARDLILNPI